MNRLFIKTILIVSIFLFGCYIKALDNREVLENIEATSNTSSIPNYGGVIQAPTFTITDGLEAHFDISESRWKRYDGNNLLTVIDGYRFNTGSWRYRLKVVIDGQIGASLRLGSQTTITIDGVAWSFDYCSTCAEGNKTVGYATSPSYALENNGELYYFEEESFRVYTNYITVNIIPFSVSSTVEGGTEPYVFSKVSGPEWVSVSSTGTISGTPTALGENDNLVVRVTDANDDYKEITVPVDKTILPPALRTPIERIEATSNIESLPVIDSELTIPTFNMVTSEGAYFADYSGKWYKKIGDQWKEQTGVFTPGKWQYRSYLNLEGENAEMQSLTDDSVVVVNNVEWESALSGCGNEFYSLDVKSPEYNLVGKINSIELDGNIKEPKIGDNIVEPTIWIKSINGDNSLINNADVEAFWQYKTGDGFFDWADASGKFEANKTYHIRLLITINSDYYENNNIANFPVTYDGYTLTQFQFNNKTVGEFIEFPKLSSIMVPTVNISNNNNKVTLTWEEDSNATKFEVYRSENNKKWTKLGIVTTNSYVDKSLTYNKKYYYKVRAYDGTRWTSYSNIVNKTIKPNKVTNLKITSAGTNNIKLSWDKVSVTGYEVYRSTDNKKWSKVTTITKNSTLTYNNKKLSANKKYYYKVRAYKTVSGEKIYGSYSAVVYTRTAPVKPSVSLSYRDLHNMNLKIGSVKGASNYKVYKSTDGTNYELIEELPVAGTLAVEVEGGTTYYYRVRACNSYNRCSGLVTVSKKHTTKAPGFSLKTSSKKVTVTLNSVEGADAYEIYRATSKNGKYKLVKSIPSEDTLTFVDSTKKGTTYYYKTRTYRVVNGKKIYSSYSGVKCIRSK